MVRNKRNKTLIISISLLITALFIGTNVSSVVAQEISSDSFTSEEEAREYKIYLDNLAEEKAAKEKEDVKPPEPELSAASEEDDTDISSDDIIQPPIPPDEEDKKDESYCAACHASEQDYFSDAQSEIDRLINKLSEEDFLLLQEILNNPEINAGISQLTDAELQAYYYYSLGRSASSMEALASEMENADLSQLLQNKANLVQSSMGQSGTIEIGGMQMMAMGTLPADGGCSFNEEYEHCVEAFLDNHPGVQATINAGINFLNNNPELLACCGITTVFNGITTVFNVGMNAWAALQALPAALGTIALYLMTHPLALYALYETVTHADEILAFIIDLIDTLEDIVETIWAWCCGDEDALASTSAAASMQTTVATTMETVATTVETETVVMESSTQSVVMVTGTTQQSGTCSL